MEGLVEAAAVVGAGACWCGVEEDSGVVEALLEVGAGRGEE